LESAPAYEGPVSSDFCPFQKDKLCTAREPRPLGCRVYYCDPSYQTRANEITEKYLARLKELADRAGIEWRYAPLHRFLNHPQEAQLSS
jgi:Fe-S-cluster containining protein